MLSVRAPVVRFSGRTDKTMRIAMGIEYDGTHFAGWQSQPHARSVQACLEQAIARVADHPVGVVCAGRTDAGVHAAGQVIHFDTRAERSPRSWILGTNSNLPPDVGVQWMKAVDDNFHARFRAQARSYRYRILNRRVRSPLYRNTATWVPQPLDEARMRAAAAHLLGEHDFSAYRAVACQAKTPVRRLTRLEVERRGEFITLTVRANAFLHHMVRNIAGVLIAIGKGERDTDWSREVLETRDRALGGITAPPQGLSLIEVEYPPEYGLPPGRPEI